MGRSAILPAMLIMAGVLHATPAVAQGPRVSPAFPSFRTTMMGPASTQRPPSLLYNSTDYAAVAIWRHDGSKRTYWFEGGVIGAVAFGVTSYFGYKAVAASLCSGSDTGGCNDYRTRITVGGAAVGFLVGALIGRGHLKQGPTAASAPD